MHNKSKNKIYAVHANDVIITTVSKIIPIKGKVQGWWYDTRATIRVSYDKDVFKTYSKENNERKYKCEMKYDLKLLESDASNLTSLLKRKSLLSMCFMSPT